MSYIVAFPFLDRLLFRFVLFIHIFFLAVSFWGRALFKSNPPWVLEAFSIPILVLGFLAIQDGAVQYLWSEHASS